MTLRFALTMLLLAACREARERPASTAPLRVGTEELAVIHAVGADSLGDSARVTRIVPEPDGETVAFTFADPGRGITNALALARRGSDSAELVWPDSVGAVWWAGAHRLAFESRTGPGGVHAVVNVHAERLEHLEGAHDVPPPARAPGTEWSVAARARATEYIDSLRVQPEGRPSEGTLRYEVMHAVPAPGDTLVAFYVTARGQGATDARRLNPTWYLLDPRSRAVVPVDSLTGDAEGMPERAAAWSDPRAFVYVRGEAVRMAKVER